MKRKKKKLSKKESELENSGHKLSCLDDGQAKDFLKKYERLIYLQCSKISYLPKLTIQDLIQECQIRLLAGYHTFNEEESKERTWVLSVVKKTLYGIWNAETGEGRAYHIESEDGEKIPVHNFSIESFFEGSDDEEQKTFEESYTGSSDGRPFLGTTFENQEELLFLVNILEVLKDRLSKEAYQFVKDQIFPPDSYQEILRLEEKFRQDLISEGFSRVQPRDEYDIYFQFSNISLNRLTVLCQIGEVLVEELGFSKENIMSHSLMTDAVF